MPAFTLCLCEFIIYQLSAMKNADHFFTNCIALSNVKEEEVSIRFMFYRWIPIVMRTPKHIQCETMEDKVLT